MKEFYDIMREDLQKENYTKKDWASGLLYMVALFGAMCLVSCLERL